MERVIREKLKEIEGQERVRIIGAFESGSRAWGFASPDSDYDVRFIYVRERNDYLRLDEVRDVIEWQLDETLDINGWDLQKTLRLLYKSNPVVFEWCASPIAYKETELFQRLKALVPMYFSCKRGAYHYCHMADNNYREYLQTPMVRLKKYFYVLRPILAAQWILRERCSPPMRFADLIAHSLSPEIEREVQMLLAMKLDTPEMGLAPKVLVLNEYIEAQLVDIKKRADSLPQEKRSWEPLNQFFVSCLADG